MSELDPTRVGAAEALFRNIEGQSGGIPELSPAFDLIAQNPGYLQDIYNNHLALIDFLATLSGPDRDLITASEERMKGKYGGSASDVSANDLLHAVHARADIIDIAEMSLDPQSTFYAQAIDDLTRKMSGGHDLFMAGRSPSDHDLEFESVIWGHTQITDPKALIHFTVGHYIERYVSASLASKGVDIALQKDFFLSALIDALIVDQNTEGAFSNIFDVWHKDKPDGLGWIVDDRLNSYQ